MADKGRRMTMVNDSRYTSSDIGKNKGIIGF